ncbi:hypothetical protein AB0F81_27600 [Actinoplanes sp. NPDC024001]|uniref:DUF7710 domain-containing protein n=1 Tax=Actinoplanes sp. NPDC024001 TaxID=3154598 RepID=UPI0033F97FC8
MSASDELERPTDEVRRHHLTKVNDVVRRPGMYGRDELAERLLLEAMAAVDGRLEQWWAECDELRDRGAFTATGVMGAYRHIVPAIASRDATASVYAEIAHRLGWLELDRALSAAEFQRLSAGVEEWVTHDRTLSELIGTFGRPSVWIGPTSAEHAKTLAYGAAGGDALVCFHVATDLSPAAPNGRATVLAVRHRRGRFANAFSFTPAGTRRKPGHGSPSLPRETVWVFHGAGARFASGVFTTLAAGLRWAAEHRVTGILAEYPIGGAYDVAVDEGRSAAQHGSLQQVHLVDGRRD